MTVEEFIQKAISAEELLNEMARKLSSTQMPEFSSELIGVEDASKLIGIPETSIRAGILNGWLPIGVALHNGKQVSGSYRGRVSFIIYPKKIWELTGHVWRGKEKLRCSENP